MKQLNTGGGNADWGSKIIKDLAFIKKKKRYPLTVRAIAPLSTLLFLSLLYGSFIGKINLSKSGTPQLIGILMIALISITAITAIYNIRQTFSFSRIATPYQLQVNMNLLQKFLQSQHLAFSQHPEAPEVFMILSKNLSIRGDYREVVIFIVDDNQVLLNSHFTGSKFAITPPSKNYKLMAKMLKDWLEANKPTSTSQSLTVN